MKTIASVANRAVIRESGPITITGNIEDNAQIEIKGGSLLVLGSIGNNVKITCTLAPVVMTSGNGAITNTFAGPIIMNGVQIGGPLPENSGSVRVQGTIGSQVQIKCDGNFDCEGPISNNFTLNTRNGHIKINAVGRDSILESRHGNINVVVAEENTILNAPNGTAQAEFAHETVQLNSRRVAQPAPPRPAAPQRPATPARQAAPQRPATQNRGSQNTSSASLVITTHSGTTFISMGGPNDRGGMTINGEHIDLNNPQNPPANPPRRR